MLDSVIPLLDRTDAGFGRSRSDHDLGHFVSIRSRVRPCTVRNDFSFPIVTNPTQNEVNSKLD